MKKVSYWSLAIALAFSFPVLTFAQELGDANTFVENLGEIVQLAIPIAAGLALLGFFFGLAKYIFQSGNQEDQDDAKQIMIWGVIALFLIAAIGGIISALEASLGLEDGSFTPTDFGGSI